jgi:hypothetical protein
MNISGHRISTTEVESALVDHPAVAEAAVVGATDPTTGQAIIAYVILRGGNDEPSDELGEEIRQHVAKKLGAIARPKAVISCPTCPRPARGKIMRRLLRDVAEGRDLGDTTTLADLSRGSSELQGDVEVVLLEGGDDGLEVVALLAVTRSCSPWVWDWMPLTPPLDELVELAGLVRC